MICGCRTIILNYSTIIQQQHPLFTSRVIPYVSIESKYYPSTNHPYYQSDSRGSPRLHHIFRTSRGLAVGHFVSLPLRQLYFFLYQNDRFKSAAVCPTREIRRTLVDRGVLAGLERIIGVQGLPISLTKHDRETHRPLV